MRALSFAAAVAIALPSPVLARIQPSPAPFLASKVAGPARDCLANFQRDRETRTYASGDILYRGEGTTWYLNHPEGCPRFTSDMVFVTKTPVQLCRGDIVEIYQQVSNSFLGACTLGAFTPYTDPSK
ncbi:hypothetical protein [Sphingomonas sp.]|uniref:hypothetical protein n=1 Tax=Sphingomonas sp. TaxID=28214 RepID=UPI003B007AEB